ncbi:alpha/beta hydrolase family protein [Krasilnikovia sp. MM14-A1004]|uniref:alpha/beta hydrolase family protein n=1 Tax=Krasilnikovia sp. MM14-A1004 TaxID=3373541 RepID=UPI00399C89C8
MMRRTIMAAGLAAALVLGTGAQAWADPAEPPATAHLPSGWSFDNGRLTWQAPQRVPMGDAAIEFYSGDHLLGRARAGSDHRTFALDVGAVPSLDGLQVRAGGRRLDAAPEAGLRRRSAPPPPRQLPPGPAAAVDPGRPGPYATITGEYDLPGVKLPDFPKKVEMRAVVVAPKGAPGKRPLALLLHGRHFTCFHGKDEDKVTGDWPCPAGTEPIPSHRGYLQAQKLLASQGYVTVSISANGVNGQDYAADDGGAQARSSLVRLHLAHWADWAGSGRGHAPAIVRSAPPADLSKVLLMGHSRGGEGVNRAAMDSLSPPPAARDGYHGKVRWTIRGTLLIGPTIFGQNPTPDVPSATILPGCDGDVSDLQGQMYVDATRGVGNGRALHSAVYVVGANHNFFNTEWTPGQAAAPAWDDYANSDDPLCTAGKPTRLTAGQEQTVGATYLAAAARLFVAGDDRARPLLDGSGLRAPSADPARVLTHALGGGRTPVLLPDQTTKASGARVCAESTDVAKDACLDPQTVTATSPHFVPFVVPEAGRYAVRLDWSAPGKQATVRPAHPVTLGGARQLALRIVVAPNTSGTPFAVAVTDRAGKRTELGTVTVDGLPGTDFSAAYWGQEVRVAVPAGLRDIAALHLTPKQGSGAAWLMDAWTWRPGSPAPHPTALPRIDLGSLTVKEGDKGSKTYTIPVRVSGSGSGAVRLFLTNPLTYHPVAWVAKIKPGTRSIRVPVKVEGNTRYGEDREYTLNAKAVHGLVVGGYVGALKVRDDDPQPKVTVTPVHDKVAEGGTLSWKVTSSAPADSPLYLQFTPKAPAAGAELSSTDVAADWFTTNSGEEPEPSRPLSGTQLQPYVVLDAGVTSAELTVPTVEDSAKEPDEHVEFAAGLLPREFGDPIPLGTLTGTVTP